MEKPEGNKPRGVTCPRCGCAMSAVLETRRMTKRYTLRRRECRHCGAHFSTREIPADGLTEQNP